MGGLPRIFGMASAVLWLGELPADPALEALVLLIMGSFVGLPLILFLLALSRSHEIRSSPWTVLAACAAWGMMSGVALHEFVGGRTVFLVSAAVGLLAGVVGASLVRRRRRR